MSEVDALTEALGTDSLATLGGLLLQEAKREKPRPYIITRIARRAHRRMADRLYSLPSSVKPNKGETGEAYIKRLYGIALKEG